MYYTWSADVSDTVTLAISVFVFILFVGIIHSIFRQVLPECPFQTRSRECLQVVVVYYRST
jgi:F0F1-type ATP synthase membrane subunit a